MKPLITALGICALLLAPAGAYAGANFTWDGEYGNSVWDAGTPIFYNDSNWNRPGWPGRMAGDTATINLSTLTNPVTLNSELDYPIDTLLIDADAANASIGLDIQANGDLETTGKVTLTAGTTASEHVYCTVSGAFEVNDEVELNAASAVASHATMTVSSGATFTPNSMDLNGAPTTANGDAILIFNEDVTVQTNTGVDVTGFAQVQVGADDICDCFRLDVGDGALHSELDMNTAAGTMIAERLVVMGGDGGTEHGILKVSFAGAEFYTE